MRLAWCACLAISSWGCDDDGATPAGPDADLGLPEFTVTNMDVSGDQHSFTIRCTDLASELPVTFTTDGPHPHTLRLEVEELQRIATGVAVETTFTEGHEHAFSITKPQDACKLP